MTRQLFTATLGFGLLILCASAAFGQTVRCGDRAAIVATLADRYGETRQAIALDAANRVVEVFASADSGSWTILVTDPAGQSCLLGHGTAFDLVDETAAQGEAI